jgi:hypothetical protein
MSQFTENVVNGIRYVNVLRIPYFILEARHHRGPCIFIIQSLCEQFNQIINFHKKGHPLERHFLTVHRFIAESHATCEHRGANVSGQQVAHIRVTDEWVDADGGGESGPARERERLPEAA